MADPAATDQGPVPFVIDIESATLDNDAFRSTLWTGSHLQLTVMSIEPGDDIGLEVHDDGDQFLRVEAGHGRVQMGPTEQDLNVDREVGPHQVILVAAGVWHNVTNIGDEPLKLYALYGPPEHPRGTVHPTSADAEADEHDH